MSLVWGLGAAAFILAFIGTYFARRYALSRQLLDIAGHRSSHQGETPRGGGIAVVITMLVVLPGAVGGIWLDGSFLALWGGGLLIALVGYWDDHVSLPARWRFGMQLLLAAGVIGLLGGAPSLDFLQSLGVGWLAAPIAVAGLVWWVNLFNFMDGIDGLASVEALSILGGAMLLLGLKGELQWLFPMALLGFAVLGFLCWNWAPAKIFMGDVGSYFIGFLLGVFALITLKQELIPLWAWLTLTAVFWVDATYTLLVRLASGQRWYQAHRSHGYQIAARRLNSHARTSLLVLAINSLWLLPLGLACVFFPGYGPLILVIAVMPLLVIAWQLKAGLNNT